MFSQQKRVELSSSSAAAPGAAGDQNSQHPPMAKNGESKDISSR